MTNQPLPFIPAWLDDCAVSPHSFRVLVHLWRRADTTKGPPWTCYPASRSMATACRMKRDTVFHALRELEEAGLLTRQTQLGRGNLYSLTCPERGDTHQSGASPETGHHPSPETGHGLSRKGGHKGTPYKVPQDKVPQGPAITSSKPRGSDTVEAAIYAAYPRKVKRDAATKAIAKSLAELGRSGDHPGHDTPAAYLLDRVTTYARAVKDWPTDRRQFIPHPSSWFTSGQYADDPAEWNHRAPTDTAPKGPTTIYV